MQNNFINMSLGGSQGSTDHLQIFQTLQEDLLDHLFFVQSASTAPVYHHTGNVQGLHNIRGGFNIPNMPASLGSRKFAVNVVPSNGVQQPAGSLSYVSCQHTWAFRIGGLSSFRKHWSSNYKLDGNIVGAGNMARSLSSGGGLSMPGLASQLKLTDYSLDLPQKELNDSSRLMMLSQHFPMGRSSGFSLGGSYSSHFQQQQQQASSIERNTCDMGFIHLCGGHITILPNPREKKKYVETKSIFTSQILKLIRGTMSLCLCERENLIQVSNSQWIGIGLVVFMNLDKRTMTIEKSNKRTEMKKHNKEKKRER